MMPDRQGLDRSLQTPAGFRSVGRDSACLSCISVVQYAIMRRKSIRHVASFVAGIALAAAQTTHSSIVGVVLDATGAGVNGASVRAVFDATGTIRQTQADASGSFVLSGLPPGSYTLVIEQPGFKKYERKAVPLPPNERLSLGTIRLELGAVTETISVTAEGATVQTASAERSGLITSSQMHQLSIINRDFSVLVSLLPGVVATPRGETVGFGGNATFNVQGGRNTSNNINIDGVPAGDLGNQFSVTSFVSMDAISEVKILVSNFTAEFGRKPGANIQAATKSGGKQFHGTLYWYQRHEQFNANNFFNNRNFVPEPPYRYTTAGYNIGGPVLFPGKWNRDRDKLFFFFSQEFLREQRPQPILQVTTPTLAERGGDFSASRDVNGALIVVRDPLSNRQPFPANIVPANRIHPAGRAFLNLLPEPNFFDIGISARRYNYQVQESLQAPKHAETARIDYNRSSHNLVYLRYSQWWEDIRGFAVPGGNANWGWLPSTYLNTAKSVSLNWTHIVSPAAVLEFSAGLNRATEKGTPLRQEYVDRLRRDRAGFTVGQFHPENNPLNLVPRASFGGLTQPANPTVENRFPLRGSDTLFTWSAIFTRTQGPHTLKFGLWAERARNFEGEDGVFNGDFNFGRDVNNPFDSNHPFANALLGYFASYTESTTRPWEQSRSTLIEWFAQDNWKAASRLTLDYGLRFSWAQPYHNFRREEAGFVPSRYDPSKRVRLIEPVRVGNARMGRHPVTGALYPAAAIGALAPGLGDPTNGIVLNTADRNYPAGLRQTSGVRLGPRFGLAYDPFGRGKTALRAGFGVFFEGREQGNRGFGTWRNPPLRADPVIYYGHFDSLLSSTGVEFPSSVTGFNPRFPLQQTMHVNFGVQHHLGFGTVADISYVAALGRDLLFAINRNAIPFGANFRPENADPTNPGRPLPAAFLRPIVGYNNITIYEYGSNSSYHSLQAALNRRYARGLEFGGSWTWSKAMDYVDANTGAVSSLINPKVWNYGKAGFDRTHTLTVYFIVDLPKASGRWNHAWARQALDGWQLSGIATFQSGAPLGIGLGFVNAVDVTGSPTDGARVVVLENPILPKGSRTFSRNFNTQAFAPPEQGTFGNAPKDVIRGPGINNWDVSLFKDFAVARERVRLQLRGEFYNAFNHAQFSGLDTATRFDAQGRQANPRLGEFTAARAARRIQLALRLRF